MKQVGGYWWSFGLIKDGSAACVVTRSWERLWEERRSVSVNTAGLLAAAASFSPSLHLIFPFVSQTETRAQALTDAACHTLVKPTQTVAAPVSLCGFAAIPPLFASP